MYVIVDQGGGQEYDTRVLTTSIGRPRTKPTTYAEAVIQQHPDIEKMMDKLCRELAKCKLSPKDRGLETVLLEKMTDSATAQASFGHKAVYRTVHFDEKEGKRG